MQTLTAQHTGADGKLNIDPSVLIKALATIIPAETATPKTRKTKAVRDPNAPKKPQSAFFLWSADNRADARAELEAAAEPDTKVSAAQVSKLLGQKWKLVSVEDKAPYEESAKAESAKYAELKAAYEAEHGIVPTPRRSTKFDSSVEPSAPEGWTGPFDGYLEKAPKDPETGKNFTKAFHSFEDAVAAAVRLNAGGITRTPQGFKLRLGREPASNASSRSKNEKCWIRAPSETPVEDPVEETVEESVPVPQTNIDDLPPPSVEVSNDNEHEVEAEEASVEEFEHQGVTYLKDDEGNLYPDNDDDEGDAIGKVNADGTVELF